MNAEHCRLELALLTPHEHARRNLLPERAAEWIALSQARASWEIAAQLAELNGSSTKSHKEYDCFRCNAHGTDAEHEIHLEQNLPDPITGKRPRGPNNISS